MSAGALFGYIFNVLSFIGIWWVVGACIDRISTAFNHTMTVLPTFQDAVNGFSMSQVLYVSLPVIAFIGFSVNYFLTANSSQTGEV